MHDALHTASATPSTWLTRFAPLVAAGGEVLDYACGSGRHARWLAQRGFRVEAVDRDGIALQLLHGLPKVHTREADLEGAAWPLEGRQFDAVVVSNYLFRPRFSLLLALLCPGGVLIYETFMVGNERFGKPSNPEFLLRPNELLERLAGEWTIVAFAQGEVQSPRPAVVQRICAVRGLPAALVLPLA